MIFGRKKMMRQAAEMPNPGIDASMSATLPASQPQSMGTGGRILRSVLDGLSVATGGQPAYFNGIQAQRQAQLDAQNAERERQAGMKDYEQKQQIEAKYRAPQVNDTERDYELYTRLYGVDKAKELLARPQYVPLADGRFMQLGGFNPNDAESSQPVPDQAEIERFVSSFPSEAQAAIRQRVADGALGSVPGGSPVAQKPRSKRLSNGTTAYFVNGAWYDNPEGR